MVVLYHSPGAQAEDVDNVQTLPARSLTQTVKHRLLHWQRNSRRHSNITQTRIMGSALRRSHFFILPITTPIKTCTTDNIYMLQYHLQACARSSVG